MPESLRHWWMSLVFDVIDGQAYNQINNKSPHVSRGNGGDLFKAKVFLLQKYCGPMLLCASQIMGAEDIAFFAKHESIISITQSS